MPQKIPHSFHELWASSPKKQVYIWSSQKKSLPLHPMMSHKTAGGSSSGVHWMHFIAECGIEYGCQFVNQFFLYPPQTAFIQRKAEKSCKVTKKREKCKTKNSFSFHFRVSMSWLVKDMILLGRPWRSCEPMVSHLATVPKSLYPLKVTSERVADDFGTG